MAQPIQKWTNPHQYKLPFKGRPTSDQHPAAIDFFLNQLNNNEKFSHIDPNSVEIIGTGSFGVVWKVFDCQSKKLYAVKIVSFKQGDEHLYQRSKIEAQIHNYIRRHKFNSQFQHVRACLPITYQELINKDFFYATMELIVQDKTTYYQHSPEKLAEVSPMPDSTLESITFQLLSTIQYLHHCGILHRDIKAENILIMNPHDQPNISHEIPNVPIIKLIDFGLSKIDQEQFQNTQTIYQNGDILTQSSINNNPANILTQSLVGTPITQSPDLLVKTKESTISGVNADLFAIGITILTFAFGYCPGFGLLENRTIGLKSCNSKAILTEIREKSTFENYVQEYEDVYHAKAIQLTTSHSKRTFTPEFRQALQLLISQTEPRAVYETTWYKLQLKKVRGPLLDYLLYSLGS